MINLVEKLKNAPKGTKLYSLIHGEVELLFIEEDWAYPIFVESTTTTRRHLFDSYGKMHCDYGECVLFPSKENLDWNTFPVESPKFDIPELKPFDKVLTRDYDNEFWECNIFNRFIEGETYAFKCILSLWMQCIPYNDETKHLAGTTGDCPEYYKTW